MEQLEQNPNHHKLHIDLKKEINRYERFTACGCDPQKSIKKAKQILAL